MARTIRLLAFSAFLLIFPIRATPPAVHTSLVPLSCRTIRGKTVLIRKCLLLQRSLSGDETKARFRIYDITVLSQLDQAAPVRRQQADTSDQFAMGVHEEFQPKAAEVFYGTANNRPLLPMPQANRFRRMFCLLQGSWEGNV